MLRIWQPLAVGMVVVGMLGCSAGKHQNVRGHLWNKSNMAALFENCEDTKTTMRLPNGNTLYIFGKGADDTVETPVQSVPGHDLVMLSGDGKPAKIVKTTKRHMSGDKTATQERIVWVETDNCGNVLLAGCAGCTAEENQFLATAGETGQDQELLSSLLDE